MLLLSPQSFIFPLNDQTTERTKELLKSNLSGHTKKPVLFQMKATTRNDQRNFKKPKAENLLPHISVQGGLW